jgi:hypothetical protein
LFVPANLRYGFRTQGPFAFLNYRDDVSMIYTGTSKIGRYETVNGSGNELHDAEAEEHPRRTRHPTFDRMPCWSVLNYGEEVTPFGARAGRTSDR